MAASEDIIRNLNELFAEEVEAAMRYLHLAATLKGLDRLIVRETLLQSMQETLEHAQTIAAKIIQLGGVPRAKLQLELPAEMQSASEAIRTALAFEQAALDGYRELLEKAGNDVVLEEFVRAQIAIESEHVSQLYLLLDA
jgi:bacterioferritin